MRSRLYEDKYYDMIESWQKARGLEFVPKEFIPTHGIVIEDLACGFIFCTDSSLGIIEYFITNPNADTIKKAKALDLIAGNLILLSKELGIKAIKIASDVRGIKKLAQKHGFKDAGEFTSLFRGV